MTNHRTWCQVCSRDVRAYHDEPHTAIVHDGPDGKRCDGSPGGVLSHLDKHSAPPARKE